ncbi:MAG: O-antigen ligase family protein [Lachnospiraceae bacterium]|nr:O-antigen ligase family protein [Lachnospiraceae bacterium]
MQLVIWFFLTIFMLIGLPSSVHWTAKAGLTIGLALVGLIVFAVRIYCVRKTNPTSHTYRVNMTDGVILIMALITVGASLWAYFVDGFPLTGVTREGFPVILADLLLLWLVKHSGTQWASTQQEMSKPREEVEQHMAGVRFIRHLLVAFNRLHRTMQNPRALLLAFTISGAIALIPAAVFLTGIAPTWNRVMNIVSPCGANFNMLAIMSCFFFGTAALLYLESGRRLFVPLLVWLGAGIVMSRTDSVVLGLALLAVIAIYGALRNGYPLRRLLVIAGAFFWGFGLVAILRLLAPNWYTRLENSGLSRFVVRFPLGIFILAGAVCLIIVGIISSVQNHAGNTGADEQSTRTADCAITVFVIIGLAATLVILANLGLVTLPTTLQDKLVIHDHWGTARGAIWRVSLEEWQQFPLRQKLIGVGTDRFFDEMVRHIDHFPSHVDPRFLLPHNIFLKILIENGLLGLATFLALTLAGIRSFIKGEKSLLRLTAVMVMLMYLSMEMLLVSSPEVTPVVVIFMGLLLRPSDVARASCC